MLFWVLSGVLAFVLSFIMDRYMGCSTTIRSIFQEMFTYVILGPFALAFHLFILYVAICEMCDWSWLDKKFFVKKKENS